MVLNVVFTLKALTLCLFNSNFMLLYFLGLTVIDASFLNALS